MIKHLKEALAFSKEFEENYNKEFNDKLISADELTEREKYFKKFKEQSQANKDVTNCTLKCKCGNIIDRDYNSAINLLKFGESVVYNKSHQTLGKELSEYKAFKCLDFSRSNT